MRKRTIGLAIAALIAAAGAAWSLWPPAATQPPKPQSPFHDWAVVLVSGEWRAHSGAPTAVFDNGRRDLAAAFAGIGFSRANMVQFSVDYDKGTRHTETRAIADALHETAKKAGGGCLIYVTSHGTPEGIVTGDAVWPPDDFARMVNGNCGARPSVVVMSACYSGQFVAPLQADNRVVITAARPDRTSFGCGEMDRYTYFDDCFLRAMKLATDFPGLGDLARQCVAERESLAGIDEPSEPQLFVGSGVAYTLRWR